MIQEAESWPYEFPVSKDYIKSNQRGTVRGKLVVNDRYIFIYITLNRNDTRSQKVINAFWFLGLKSTCTLTSAILGWVL